MNNPTNLLTFMGDFETTVYDNQTFTEVWASALVPLYTEDVEIFHSIDDTWEYLKSLNRSCVVYYHNLKFDGTFWIDFIMKKTNLTLALQTDPAGISYWINDKDMPTNSYKYTISDMGNWYGIYIKLPKRTIEIRDSLKLLPFSVKRIGQSFGTKHKKLDMEYTGFRYAGCEITPEEQSYIKNDVLVVKEALEIMFDQGHNDLTIGSCCLREFRKTMMGWDYKTFFPNLYDIELDNDLYGSPNVGEYIRKSYRGGWCYLVKGKENKVFKNGTTADVNSLYPSMMHSMSGNRYPVGKPIFWNGNKIPEKANKPNIFYFIRIKTRFKIKPDHLPFIQIKNNIIYRSTEALETSDYYDRQLKRHYRYYRTKDGVRHDTFVTLTMTMIDYKLMLEHYDLIDCEILDGCMFQSEIGLFDNYINKYKEIKMNNKGAIRELAKLFLNNLYGKMASSTNSSFKVGTLDEDGVVHYAIQPEDDKRPGYIPIGSAITSYARNFTIRAAQMNYHGKHKRGFIYADTDSIHCDLEPDEIVGAPQHDTEFCHWKYESCWDYAWFVRQKTYIEYIDKENLKPIEHPYFQIKCAGMPDKCKNLFLKSMTQDYKEEDYNEEELEFLKTQRSIRDFTVGLCVPGKLIPKHIPGGTLLVETTYELR